MATTAAQRETIAQNIMKKGKGVVCIANPRGATVDAILVKDPSFHTPANATTVVVWVEYSGDAATSAYLP